jgi:alkanesulfonate monooxygenase SsuD/methylene tetrahydromethanopterin reductase-like flavin-dependent oxidoreductase (luciferase family)
MTDYGHDLQFGTFVTPVAEPVRQALELAVASEAAGLDLVTFQDHPYLPRFHDTWTLIAYAAARTSRIHLAGNVLNLPLRPPGVLARSVASLDRLSHGRIELALGAGGFWDAIEAMGPRRLTAGESIRALAEGIDVIRQTWAVNDPGPVRVQGEFYQVSGAKRGPAPAHDVQIWVGAYKPRILRMVGRLADGVLPSLSYLPGGPDDLAEINRHIDEAALGASRKPASIRRLLNIAGQFAPAGRAFLNGPAEQWAEDLAGLTLEHGVSTFILATDDPATIERFGAEVAPATRELVAAERG